MNPRTINLTGQRFGNLLVIGIAPSAHHQARWECLCKCGDTKIVTGGHLRRGTTRGCRRCSCKNLTHGMHNSPEYKAFTAAKQRCTNPNVRNWKHYGGRGIEFHFASFEEFLAHLGPRPSADHSLDRIETNGHYEPGNVRWATEDEQRRNKRPYKIVNKSLRMRNECGQFFGKAIRGESAEAAQ